MSYLDESGLSIYDSNLKGWISSQDSKTITSNIYPWTKTAKAGVVSCYPVGGTELKPVVNFLFTETSPASGNKGPENPSDINGVSSIIVTQCENIGTDETKYIIDLDNIYYGGSIDLTTGLMTVTHWGFALDGTEQWRTVGTVGSDFRHDLTNSAYPALKKISGIATCSHFSTATSGDLRMYISAVLGGTTWFLVCVDTNAVYPTTDAWKSFLATQYANGTPVTLAYKLTDSYTVQLDPIPILALVQQDKYTPRLNTIYTNVSSVQVGYVKSPIREEYELTQAIIGQGNNS